MPNDKSDWTLDALKAYFDALMVAHEHADQQRHETERAAAALAATSMVAAMDKSERSLDKRLDAMNEFRNQLGDQARSFLPRAEYSVQQQAFSDRMTTVETYMVAQQGQKEGLSSGARVVLGAAGFLLTVITIVSMILVFAGK